ncbi:MAG: Ca2+/H+ antiporter, family, partial [Actinomycetota bacterium]|nr:Ca2+/H+ antiporter, family [Actinomycetota bacterium]
TITLATTENLVGTWIGSTLGMVAADALAIVVGALLGKRLPERAVRIGAAATFVVFGLLLIAEALR